MSARIPTLEVLLHRAKHRCVVLVAGQFQELRGIVEPALHRRDDLHEIAQRRPLPAEGACVLGIVPDFRLFQVEIDFLEARLLGLEVKDTP